MLDFLNPRLTIYLFSNKHSVPKYIYTKLPTYKTSPIVIITTTYSLLLEGLS